MSTMALKVRGLDFDLLREQNVKRLARWQADSYGVPVLGRTALELLAQE